MKFSIGIPAFKAKYLDECILSLLNQTYQDFELIIINDSSPENVKEIALKHNDPRIKYYENEKNIGAEHVVDNWNLCLSKAKGDFFILLGDDDILDSEYLEITNFYITKFTQVNILHCRTQIIDENGEKILITPELPENESMIDLIFQRIVNKRNQFISDFIFRTSMLIKIGGFYKLPLAQMSDDITAFIMSKYSGVVNINQPLFIYRRHSSTISSIGNVELTLRSLKDGQMWVSQELLDYVTLDVNVLNKIKKTQRKSIVYFRNLRISTLVRSLLKERFWEIKKWQQFRKKNLISYCDIFMTVPIAIKVLFITKLKEYLKYK